MCGLARVDHGTVTVGERDVTRARPATIANQGVARSYQAPRLPAELTPHELVAGVLAHMQAIGSPHWLFNDPKAIRVRRQSGRLADEIIAAAGLERAGNEPNRNLTSGQRRILDVLMALTSRASIVLLDEPAAGLSGDERRALGATITSLAGRGMAFLVVEHDLELGFSLADEVTVLAGGRIVAQGDAPTIREHALAREALMGAAA